MRTHTVHTHHPGMVSLRSMNPPIVRRMRVDSALPCITPSSCASDTLGLLCTCRGQSWSRTRMHEARSNVGQGGVKGAHEAALARTMLRAMAPTDRNNATAI